MVNVSAGASDVSCDSADHTTTTSFLEEEKGWPGKRSKCLRAID